MKKIICLFAFLALCSLATARGKIISFSDMIKSSKYIFIGTYEGSHLRRTRFDLTVESVLKGNLTKKKITVGKTKSGTPYAEKGKRLIAFINWKNEWEWVGLSKDLENGLIHMSGFYDWNFYDVSPIGITLPQLKTYLATGSYSGKVTGDLEIFSLESLEWEKYPLNFEIDYSYTEDMTITLKNSGKTITTFKDDLELYGWGYGVAITYSRNTYRPLKFYGFTDSIDATGTQFSATFEIDDPKDITAEEFEKYISDPSMGYIYYEMQLKMDSATYTIMYGDSTSNSGVHLILSDNRKLDYSEMTFPDTESGGNIKFSFRNPEFLIELNKFEKYIKYDELTFFQRLYLEPLSGEFFAIKDGQNVSLGKCVLSLKKKYFAKY